MVGLQGNTPVFASDSLGLLRILNKGPQVEAFLFDSNYAHTAVGVPSGLASNLGLFTTGPFNLDGQRRVDLVSVSPPLKFYFLEQNVLTM